MRTTLFIFLLTAAFCWGAEIELPRQEVPAQTDRYEIIAPSPESAKIACERLACLFQALQLLVGEHIQAPPKQERMRVVIYRNKQEYHRELLPIEPSIDLTNGLYNAQRKTMYLYSPETKVLFHEGTHQIFMEHFFSGQTPEFPNNFWAVEGIALFMETLQMEDESYKVGNILADRLYAAKVYHERGYNMPIRKLTAMSAAEVQSSAQRQQIYSQSATLFHWLMFAERGAYRKALFELLRLAYLGTAKAETLSELTGLSYEELDAKYLEFLGEIPR